jgi:hypothetical protein
MKLPAGDQQESTAPESRLAENRTVTPSPEVHDDKRPRQSKNVETPPLGMDAEEVAPARDGKPAPRESAHQGESAFPRPAAADRPVPGPAGASAVHVPPPTNPPQLVVVPPVPDLRPQFEVFMNTVVCNQQLMIDLLQDAQQVLNAHATQISELRRQIERQQNTMSNLRRF